jgi:hypothetical protein
MQIIRTQEDASTIADPELRQLIARVHESVIEFPEILYFILIVEVGDTIAMLDTQLGFPILTTPREILEEHAGYFEMVFVISDDGSGVEVFIPKTEGVDSDLLAMCEMHVLSPDVTP